eukprot:TRINITY_DN3725_c0_g1_i1.p1 TRINITY_DN3725_c0_g1~~TRINITY_DN3725_c0_g1_i1.p1  ORF type:complete len:327 (-),score=26.89 TRINITY_DN3725_c0_g1_i1:1082-2062(-)
MLPKSQIQLQQAAEVATVSQLVSELREPVLHPCDLSIAAAYLVLNQYPQWKVRLWNSSIGCTTSKKDLKCTLDNVVVVETNLQVLFVDCEFKSRFQLKWATRDYSEWLGNLPDVLVANFAELRHRVHICGERALACLRAYHRDIPPWRRSENILAAYFALANDVDLPDFQALAESPQKLNPAAAPESDEKLTLQARACHGGTPEGSLSQSRSSSKLDCVGETLSPGSDLQGLSPEQPSAASTQLRGQSLHAESLSSQSWEVPRSTSKLDLESDEVCGYSVESAEPRSLLSLELESHSQRQWASPSALSWAVPSLVGWWRGRSRRGQ